MHRRSCNWCKRKSLPASSLSLRFCWSRDAFARCVHFWASYQLRPTNQAYQSNSNNKTVKKYPSPSLATPRSSKVADKCRRCASFAEHSIDDRRAFAATLNWSIVAPIEKSVKCYSKYSFEPDVVENGEQPLCWSVSNGFRCHLHDVSNSFLHILMAFSKFFPRFRKKFPAFSFVFTIFSVAVEANCPLYDWKRRLIFFKIVFRFFFFWSLS